MTDRFITVAFITVALMTDRFITCLPSCNCLVYRKKDTKCNVIDLCLVDEFERGPYRRQTGHVTAAQ